MVPVGAPGDEEVGLVLARVLREAKKDWEQLEATWPEDEYEELQQRAIQERLGLGETKERGQRRQRVGVEQGFSLHADTAVQGKDREGLERLVRYGARGPVAERRLRRLENGSYEYTPKKGTAFTHTAEALVRRLVALLPPGRLHLTSFHGTYAPNSGLRGAVTRPACVFHASRSPVPREADRAFHAKPITRAGVTRLVPSTSTPSASWSSLRPFS
jgi:Putative transposase